MIRKVIAALAAVLLATLVTITSMSTAYASGDCKKVDPATGKLVDCPTMPSDPPAPTPAAPKPTPKPSTTPAPKPTAHPDPKPPTHQQPTVHQPTVSQPKPPTVPVTIADPAPKKAPVIHHPSAPKKETKPKTTDKAFARAIVPPHTDTVQSAACPPLAKDNGTNWWLWLGVLAAAAGAALLFGRRKKDDIEDDTTDGTDGTDGTDSTDDAADGDTDGDDVTEGASAPSRGQALLLAVVAWLGVMYRSLRDRISALRARVREAQIQRHEAKLARLRPSS